MSDDDLEQLGAVLDKGPGRIHRVYATNMADQVAASIKAREQVRLRGDRRERRRAGQADQGGG